jgi:hypothetical protein
LEVRRTFALDADFNGVAPFAAANVSAQLPPAFAAPTIFHPLGP